MPYRRLPNTDQARVRALRNAIMENESRIDAGDFQLPYPLINEAKNYLSDFEKALAQYQQALDAQVSANKNYQHESHVARLYISHFIQVLNLAVLRKDIKRDHKVFYHLKPDDFTVPDLSTEAAILKWGQILIDGETERMRNGGAPMYNPGIAKVQVHYEEFKDYKISQKIYQQSTARYLQRVADKRKEGDAIILRIWNEVEAHFAMLPPYKRLMECQKYGLVYYYRRKEEKLTPESDINYIPPTPIPQFAHRERAKTARLDEK